MDILILLIPLSVVLALMIGAGFWWAVRNGQFDDLEGPAHHVVADDDRPVVPPIAAPGTLAGTPGPAPRGEAAQGDHLISVKPSRECGQ